MAETYFIDCANCRGQKVVRIENTRGQKALIPCPVCKGEGKLEVTELSEEDYRKAFEEQEEDRRNEP